MSEGTCAICGKRAKLTDEHLPPKAAFNNYPLLIREVDSALTRKKGQLTWQSPQARVGRYLKRLCERCNGRTGSWYGADYRDFVKVAAESRIPPGDTGDLSFEGRPAGVAKEALACICTSVGPDLASECEVIRKLILYNKFRCCPSDFRLWVYLRALPGAHQTGTAVIKHLDTGAEEVVTEFSHWPVGWVLSWHDRDLPRLCEVTHWLDMEYKPYSVTITVPRLWTLTGYPLDNRNPHEVQRDRERNLRARADRLRQMRER